MEVKNVSAQCNGGDSPDVIIVEDANKKGA